LRLKSGEVVSGPLKAIWCHEHPMCWQLAPSCETTAELACGLISPYVCAERS
jgi:hypothetical protein